MKSKSPYLALVFILVVLDQLAKILVAKNVPLLTQINIIPGFFNLTHIQNRGAIFGFFSQSGSQLVHVLLMLASLVALSLVLFYFFKTPTKESFMMISLSLILAGAIGNLIGRVFRGHVIDFMDFYVNQWHWPSFNIADSCITIGAFILIFIFFFKRT
jgi:signal peptidase II